MDVSVSVIRANILKYREGKIRGEFLGPDLELIKYNLNISGVVGSNFLI